MVIGDSSITNLIMSSKKPQQVPDERDPVILQIEKFMFECENITKPLLSNNDKGLDVENLLNILSNGGECDTDINNNKRRTEQTQSADKIAIEQNKVSPIKKRTINENSDYTESKKSKNSDERKMREKKGSRPGLKQLNTNNNKRKAEQTQLPNEENTLLLIKGKIYETSDCIKMKKLRNNNEQKVCEKGKCGTQTKKQNNEKKKCEEVKSRTEPKKLNNNNNNNNNKRKTEQTQVVDKIKTNKTNSGTTDCRKAKSRTYSKKMKVNDKTDSQKDDSSGGNKGNSSKTKEKIKNISIEKAITRSSEANKEFTCARCSSSPVKTNRAGVNGQDQMPVVVATNSSNNDSCPVNIQQIKRQSEPDYVDLTEERNSLYMCLNFAKVNETEIFLESCEVIPNLVRCNAVVRMTLDGIYFPTEKPGPEIYCDLNQLVIDLTESDDYDVPQIKIISEKECANEIFYLIEKFYRIYPINRSIEKEISKVLASEDYCSKSYSQANVFGCELIESLNNKCMKNFDITRILDMIVLKLEQKCKVFISSTVIALYLYVMLNANIKSCNNRLLQDFLRESTIFVQMKRVKLEQENSSMDDETANEDNEVITEEQLNQLQHQMEQYRLICMRQETLMMKTYFRNTQNVSLPKSNNDCRSQQFLDRAADCQSFPENGELEKHIKEELLDHQLQQSDDHD